MHTQHPFIFFGTSRFSVIVLETLATHGIIPAAIITTPDTPQGRKLILTPPPTKIYAEAHNIPVYQFEKLHPDAITQIADIASSCAAEFFLVASYGLIMPSNVLNITRIGSINIHPSLLPLYRGATPLQQTILDDVNDTGISIMLMDEKMDHGPIFIQAKRENPNNWPISYSSLEKELAELSANILAKKLASIVAGDTQPTVQPHEQATFTKKISKADGQIDISQLGGAEGRKQFLKTQAFEVWPGTFFFIKKQDKEMRVKITESRWNEESNKMEILKVIPEGQKEVSYAEFLKRVESFY